MKKVLMIFFIIFTLGNIFYFNFKEVKAATLVEDIKGFNADFSKKSSLNDLKSITKKILNALRVIAVFILIIVIVTTGFRFVTSTPDVRGEIKNTMLPVIIGLIAVFGASSIASFIISAMGN